ncbi:MULTISPECIES: HlyD family secretion protein [unclassified Gilliamella]|uniref:HlyD family secretion protein n=1 Tax=unclassified Gilliamella TaxID=2685620 RepID=UPI00130AF24C|nr:MULTISPECIES: HlyD family efflux transporter periplasmic adaptor subunit [unclassified Gilliamella]MWP48430.1 HlyD family efflux transporter periplasmic adaptor subunit [Gilliamella sp. Lep-s35]MWP68291.1 HlyD family efflux transporter periplasmic adaptor subunit [Gilliamella sp. Lep-s5]MWP76570.1 HlyD family efflux transporter periplasmic adaptor subunit [Gilliamella sp. Lep-s21]
MSESNRSLFREDAINNNQVRFCGQILLTRPYSIRALTFLFSLLFISFFIFFIFFSYSRKIHVNGTLLPVDGIIRILPSESGIIDEVLVQEAQAIKQGDSLFILKNSKFLPIQADIEKFLLQRKASLIDDHQILLKQYSVKTQSAIQSKNNLEEERQLLESQIVAQKERVSIATNLVQKYRNLINSKSISLLEYEQRKSDLLDQQSILFDLQRKLTSINRDINNSDIELLQLPLQEKRDYARYTQELNAIEKEIAENNAQKFIIISAPKDGTISTIMVSKGQSIEENSLIATILPKDYTLEANLFIPSNSLGFIKLGMPVLLRYQAYPYQKFGQHKGTITEISSNAVQINELKSLGIYSQQFNNEKDAYYRVKVKLEKQNILVYGQYYPLKIGMSLEANIVLEDRKIYEWILESLFSINGDL